MEGTAGSPLWLVILTVAIGPVIAAAAVIFSNWLNARTADRTEKARQQADEQRFDAEERRLRLQLDAEHRRSTEERLFEHRLDAVARVNATFHKASNTAHYKALRGDATNEGDVEFTSALNDFLDAMDAAVFVLPAAAGERAAALPKLVTGVRYAELEEIADRRREAEDARKAFVRAARDVLQAAPQPVTEFGSAAP